MRNVLWDVGLGLGGVLCAALFIAPLWWRERQVIQREKKVDRVVQALTELGFMVDRQDVADAMLRLAAKEAAAS